LVLVLRAEARSPVGDVGRGGHREKADLADLHPRIERDRQVGDVRELKGEVAVPAGVDEPGGRVDEEPETPEARLALEAADDVVGQHDTLEGRAEDELPGVQVPGGDTPPLLLSLDPVRMGRAPDGSPSWSERALRLLDELGPFRLGFLEALVRLADWRASAIHGIPDIPSQDAGESPPVESLVLP